MQITFNGEPTTVPDGSTIADLLERQELSGKGLAVAVDGSVAVPSQWATTTIPEGAELEVLRPMQGG
ncbi:sulfur carrier protein ThiS [Enemella evansiae]|uniref:sulfur carrier protein ThiS n=1 Tax=Enemella evansiae TaxID=2016499 RepID=UPI000B96E842|nr:sulfur carrier protein ThiS [Enemella evansiae]OYO00496.1 thiamine biosynthesis protein ThiS [Enemella evansiae]OYO06092.1 thiamine biosynthesis protein ThiS [Enemella evansiae]